jgi:23S rRNA (adenine2503-C2)-methyltransferase
MPGLPLIGLDAAEIAESLAVPAFRARQIYDSIYRRHTTDPGSITSLPKELRSRIEVGLPGIAQRFESTDGTVRYLLQLADGKTVETVFMPEEGRDTICISSQVGCPVDCKFCLTALMGLERNLTAGEIVGQVLLVAAAHGLDPRDRQLNVVMMGQGEPLLNLSNVIKATRLLADPAGIGMSPRRITLSTSGIIPRMEEMGREEIRPKLAISLNASKEDQRRALMPITRKWHLADLIAACEKYPLRPWEKLTFEYVLLGGVNDSEADARRVVRLLSRLNCKVNLIALNPGPGIPFETPSPARVAAFQAILRNSFPCFVRKPRGRDIFAACGQLKRMSTGLVSLSN